MNSFGNKIIELRKENGLSQEELADKIGVSRQAISKWEIGMAIPRSSKVKKICEVFRISADELFDNESIDTNTNNKKEKEENPVASDKNKFKPKVMLKCIAMIIILFLIFHLIYAVYKFCVLTYVTNKVLQYKNLDNYYCNIRVYQTDGLYESTEIWYKNERYKIKTTYYGEEEKDDKYVLKFIDCQNKKRYIMQHNEIHLMNSDDLDFTIYKNGEFFYSNLPIMVKNTKTTNCINTLKINVFYIRKNEGVLVLKAGNTVIDLEESTYLPISYMVSQKSNGKNYYEMKYYTIHFGSVTDDDIKVEK